MLGWRCQVVADSRRNTVGEHAQRVQAAARHPMRGVHQQPAADAPAAAQPALAAVRAAGGAQLLRPRAAGLHDARQGARGESQTQTLTHMCARPHSASSPAGRTTAQAAVGSTWETGDGGPSGDELSRELDWLLDDAVAVRWPSLPTHMRRPSDADPPYACPRPPREGRCLGLAGSPPTPWVDTAAVTSTYCTITDHRIGCRRRVGVRTTRGGRRNGSSSAAHSPRETPWRCRRARRWDGCTRCGACAWTSVCPSRQAPSASMQLTTSGLSGRVAVEPAHGRACALPGKRPPPPCS
jgi:hypothetical protein